MELKELMLAFPNAIIIDNNRKEVLIIRGDKFKVYSEKYFNDLISTFDFSKFK